ncbi:beta-lactamase/transpeptidase-like protein [Thozetella sp. PMI_491]|nr:beta-lactamase/transpeptidase-like protein [Thozetella sp. PMI_491]
MSDDFFTKLEGLLSSQDAAYSDAASFVASLGIPSASVAILDNGSISAHTFSTVGDGTDTLFQACSISKPMAGLATMKLIEEGKLQLDDTLPHLVEPDVWAILSQGAGPEKLALLETVTLTQLLSHTAGFSIHGFQGYVPGATLPTVREILIGRSPANTRPIELTGLPGFCHSYSGGGFTVLQLVLEKAAQLPFPKLMQKLVLDPLGMTRSFYALQPEEKDYASAYFTGYTPADVPAVNIPEQAAAGLWTTPSDLLKAVHAVQLSLSAGEGEITYLRREIAQQMLTEVDGGYGLSWRAPRDKGDGFGHSGQNWPGWICFAFGYADLKSFLGDAPEGADPLLTGCGISIMTNSCEGAEGAMKIVEAIGYLKGWPNHPQITAARWVPLQAVGTETPTDWKEWTGTWVDDDKRVFTVAHNSAGQPTFLFAKLPPLRLVPAAIVPEVYSGKGSSIDLRIPALEMMIRLGWNGEARIVQVWYGGNLSVTDLKKAD